MKDMLVVALAAACDDTFSEREREHWACIAGCILGVLPAAETTTAAILSAATKCLDVTEVVRVLVSAVWSVHGDEPSIAAWTSKLVERARAEGHVRTVVTLVDLLTCMAGFDGVLSPETESALLAAAADPRCHAELFDAAWQYEHRFGAAVSPTWVTQFLNDERVLAGARHVPRPTTRACPACRVTPVWAWGLMRRAARRAR
jgi:hypothetical protein